MNFWITFFKITLFTPKLVYSIAIVSYYTAANAKRSFSKLKLIKKNYLQSTMTDDRLLRLAKISIKNVCALALNCDEVMNIFAYAVLKKHYVQLSIFQK